MRRRKVPRLMSGEWQRCLAEGRLGWGPLDHAEIREVTLEDVPVAALIGQILAESDLARTDAICAVGDDDWCGHELVEHCVAEAIEAPESAVWLWLMTSSAIATPLHERVEDLAAVNGSVQTRRARRLYAWVDSVGGPVVEFGHAELHAAALLRDGILPPAWKIVPAPTRLWTLMHSQAARRRASWQH